MRRVPIARDVMSSSVFTLHPEMDVCEAIDVLLRKRASGAPVVDDDKRFVGVLTEKDCLRVLSHSAFGTLECGRVCDFMSAVKGTVDVHMDIFAVAQVFLTGNFPTLPVVEDGSLVGVITRQDVLRGIQAMLHGLDAKKRRDERTLRILQSPSSIKEMQEVVATQPRESVAALFRMRHDGES